MNDQNNQKTEIDWFGRWYEIMKERGDNDEPTFGRFDLKSKEVEWFRFSHSQMDGVGVLNHLYTKRGIQLKKFPDLKEASSPSLFEYLHSFFLLLRKKKAITPAWKERNWDLKPVDLHKISYEIFSKEETSQLFELTRKSGYSLCAFLMKIASDCLLPELSSNAHGSWTLPVNLRPVLKRADFNSNHSSGILIPYTPDSTPASIHESIKLGLKNKEHWCIWAVHQIGRIIGMKGMRYLSHKSSKKTFMVGSFSYLGQWDLPENDIWVGGAPGSKNFPITIMVMIANGHLSFSLKIHPFIMADQSRTETFFKKISLEKSENHWLQNNFVIA